MSTRRLSINLLLLLGASLLAACSGVTRTPASLDPTQIAEAVAGTQTQSAAGVEPSATQPEATQAAAGSVTPTVTSATSATAGASATGEASASPSPTASPTLTGTPQAVSTPGPGPSAGPTSATPGEPGTITGALGYPSESIPRLKVYAWDRESGQWRFIVTNPNDSSYTIQVPPGKYIVFAYLNDGGSLAGAYTNAVLCGLAANCTDHTLYVVTVGSGQEVSKVNVTDWYGPPGFVPPAPG